MVTPQAAAAPRARTAKVSRFSRLPEPRQDNSNSVLERYAIELRKYGMGLAVIATRPTLISENILATCNTIICHQLTSTTDIDLALN